MNAKELRNCGLNLGLAIQIWEDQIEVEELTTMTQDELKAILHRTNRTDLKFEIERLINTKGHDRNYL